MILKSYWTTKPSLVLCPSAVDPWQNYSRLYGGVSTYYQQIDGTPSSYGLNLWVYNIPGDSLQGRLAAHHWRSITVPGNLANIPLMLDARWRGGGPSYDTAAASQPSPVPNDYSDTSGSGETGGYANYEMEHFAFPRHGKRVNSSFFDGSVRSVKLRTRTLDFAMA